MIHIISDLNINYQDHALDQNNINQVCKYIIITGNFSKENKRLMIYVDLLSKKYPNSNIIFNFGLIDVVGTPYEGVKSMLNLKVNDFKKFEKNIYLPLTPTVIGDYEFLCTFGWTYVNDLEEFKKSNLTNHTIIDWHGEIYIDDILVSKKFPRVFTMEFVNEQSKKEEELIKQWVKNKSDKQKVLITAQGPNSKKIYRTSNINIFPNIDDLSGIVWITGGDADYVGDYKNCRLITLPGPDRSRFLPLDVLDIFAQK